MPAPKLPPYASVEHIKLLVTAVGITRGSSTALGVLRRYCPPGDSLVASRVPPGDRVAACLGLLAELGADIRPVAAPQTALPARRVPRL